MKQNLKLPLKKKPAAKKKNAKLKVEGPTKVPVKLKVDAPAMHNGQLIDWTPTYQTEGSACVDLVANVPPDFTQQRRVTLHPRQSAMIDCGVTISLPNGWKAIVSPLDHLASKGLVVSQNVIVNERRVSFRVRNIAKETVVVEHGEKVGTMHVEPVYYMEFSFESSVS